MNKKVFVSLAAAAAISFTSFGAGSADAACNNNKQDTQYIKYQQIQCITKEDVQNLGELIKNQISVKPNTNCTTPEADNSTNNVTNPSEDQEDTSVSSEVSAFEQEVLKLTNAERTKAGLSPLTLDTELSKVARIKSQDMKDKNYFSHTSPTYGSPFDMMKTFGISYTSAAENIAQGQTTPKEVVEAWMNSQGHRENILNATYTHIGIGHVSDNNYWTQMFIAK